ncbi:MAG: amino acid racemase, partial [Alphaproteobacteria bacterium]|nr:amino acid racemase [Alphaproteobacteria bacterium]
MSEQTRADTVGVLGGMGPLATVDFLSRLIDVSAAQNDSEHVPVVVSSEPQIPSRPRAFFDPSNNPSPLTALRQRRDRLIAAGARCLVMPCNTAHYWFDDLTGDCPVPFIHIVQATIDEIRRRGISDGRLGLIGTEATLAGKLFESPISAAGYDCFSADDSVMQECVRPGINLVKKNRPEEAAPLFRAAIERMIDAGAVAVVLGCTEVPAGLPMSDPWVRERCI